VEGRSPAGRLIRDIRQLSTAYFAEGRPTEFLVGTAEYREFLFSEIQIEFPYAAHFFDVDGFELDHLISPLSDCANILTNSSALSFLLSANNTRLSRRQHPSSPRASQELFQRSVDEALA